MKFTIKTEGLHCGHCDAAVESALLKVEHVTDADADHETNVVIVECSEVVAPEDLIAAVEGAGEGFKVIDIQVA